MREVISETEKLSRIQIKCYVVSVWLIFLPMQTKRYSIILVSMGFNRTLNEFNLVNLDFLRTLRPLLLGISKIAIVFQSKFLLT